MADYSYETLLVDQQDKVLTITMNRPERLNAINEVMFEDLGTVFYQVGRDPEVGAVILTGAGRGFNSGGDMKDMAQRAGPHRLGPLGVINPRARRLANNMLRVEQPIICAINGPAVGLGATIALFCDIIYASDRASIGDTHIRAGLVAGDGGAVIWPLLIGLAKAKELLMTGDIIDAAEAERIGLVNKVVPHDQLMPTVMELAQRLASGPAMAIRGTKHILNQRLRNEINLTLDLGLAIEHLTSYHPDHPEAASAFVEKRTPHFKGTI